ncbi:galactocerebrosidase-like isoform X2 [Physella acuta]|uniref:galactocerebrosidase-like isoform X2 n=1 Tax=Physella acuta TaxID=109671 RepID=UPI0027DC53DF|nr:galactocerebrosidase-like isoform X2 [Physella acuta]
MKLRGEGLHFTKKTNPIGYIVFDDSQGLERQFDGIGGLSGGGATSKLLVNYPQQQLNEILDYLFKPYFGASLQILKVEIGGDIQSTDGTEASHMHNSWEENYERGYEWWLMKEAKKRNPDIKLYGLPWGFPGWLGQGTQSPYTNVTKTADYIVRWITGAKTQHNLTIDYVGIWNERNYNIDYIKTLRAMLDSRGLENVSIVASDGGWDIANDIETDAVLASAVDAIGCHYPGTYTTQESINTGKQLWASEDYSTFNDEVGGGCWARILNQNYVNGYMTATISWNLIASYYNGLPFYRDGLMTAVEPWSGNYVVETPIWLTAHTSQFTSIGWKYLKHGFGVGKLPYGGSYVGLVSPTGDQLTIVIETMTHNHSICIRPSLQPYNVYPQEVTITLAGSFSNVTAMNVWYSKLGFNGDEDIMFQKKEPLQFRSGQAILALGLDEVFTLTTLAGGQKGLYPDPPASKPFPLPYFDNFEGYSLYQEPFNLAQQTGSYEVVNNGSSNVIRQMVLNTPVVWCDADMGNKSLSIIGDQSWGDVYIELSYNIPSVNATSGVFIAARVDRGGCGANSAQGFFFFVLQAGTYVLANNLARTSVILQGPLVNQPGWHTLALLVQGNAVAGLCDGNVIFDVNLPSKPANGFAALGTDSYGLAEFDNLYLTDALDGLSRINKLKTSGSSKLTFVGERLLNV